MTNEIVLNSAAGLYCLVAVWYWYSVFLKVSEDTSMTTADKAGSLFIATVLAPIWVLLAVFMFVLILIEDNWYND